MSISQSSVNIKPPPKAAGSKERPEQVPPDKCFTIRKCFRRVLRREWIAAVSKPQQSMPDYLTTSSGQMVGSLGMRSSIARIASRFRFAFA